MSDATVLLRELAGDITQEAANTVRPSEEQVSEATQPDGENVEKPDTSKKKEKEKLQGKAKKKAKKGRFAVMLLFTSKRYQWDEYMLTPT